MQCHYCEDTLIEDDASTQQTRPCPFCHPAKSLMPPLPDWDDFWPKLECKYKGPSFRAAPWLLVLHSGGRTPNVAEFFNTTGAIARRDKPPLTVSAHINWSVTHDGFAQGVGLNRVAWHCGGAKYEGREKLNFCSIGIELPGPANRKVRPKKEIKALEETLDMLLQLVPSLKVAVRHSDIDPKKTDPGPGFSWSLIKNFGLELPFEK